MSILASEAPENLRAQAVFAAVCLTIGLGLGLRLFRPGRVNGRDRVPPRGVWPLVVVLGAGLFVWFAVPTLFFSVKQVALTRSEGVGAKLDPAKLSAADYAFLATVPAAAGFLSLLIGDLALRRTGGYDLGFGRAGAVRGIALGLGAALAVVPLLYGFMILLEWAYRRVGFEHPTEHELLRALGESPDRGINAALVVGAALMAPLFEELLFRAHLQTLLRSGMGWLHRNRRRSSAAPAYEAGFTWTGGGNVSGGATVPQPAPAAVLPYEAPPGRSTQTIPAWPTWLAIIITSLLFASVHQLWTWPPIFLLSLCLGYAYERTGNLWVPVALHAAFNSVSTALFLAGAGAN